MAVEEEAWSEDYKNLVKSIEEDLGRSICGVPTGTGEPCTKWPVDETHGRCSEHNPESNQNLTENKNAIDGSNTTEKIQSESPQSTNSDSPVAFYKNPVYWFGLIVFGITFGGAGMTAYEVILPLEKTNKTSPKQNAEESINISDPDFNKIRNMYRDGKLDEVAVALQKIIENSNSRLDRAKAYYYMFVLYQNEQEYERAVDIAEKFLRKFEDHPRRPEILYGAAFLCRRYLDEPQRAQKYITSLKENYPESKWTKELTGSS